MKKKSCLLLLVFSMPFWYLAEAKTIKNTKSKTEVYVHEPVELLYTIYHLTPVAERFIKSTKRQRDWVDVMIKPLIAPFQKHKNHKAVKAMIELGKQYDIWLPTLTSIGIQNRSLPLHPELFESKDNKAYEKDVRSFIALANLFYADTDFGKVFKNNRAVYEAIETEVKTNMPDETFFKTMETFYQKSFQSYNLCPSPLLPAGNGMGFGPRWKTDDGVMIFNVFSGVDEPRVDAKKIIKEEGFYGYSKSWVRNITTHEFGHSFVNDPLFAYKKQLDQYSLLLKPIRKKMKSQGYRDWGTVMAEHLVRMGEIRIAAQLGLTQVAEDLYHDYYINRRFIYLPHLLELIKDYEVPEKYATFEDFIPIVIKSLERVNQKKVLKAWRKQKRRKT